MALLPILRYPDPRLHLVAKPVDVVGRREKKLISDMAETMYAAPGIGLAAIQVNQPIRIIVIDVSPERRQLQVFVNPEITHKDGERVSEEGCLSVPGVYETVPRAERVKVRARNEHDEQIELEAEGLLAVCLQHEIDHLDGKVFVQYLSRLKQTRIKGKLEKQARITA